MSTVNVQPTTSARAAVAYALVGTGKRRAQHEKDGTTRAALLSCTLDSPEEIVQRAEQMSAAFRRRNEMYTYTQNFSPEEFDVKNPEHVQRVHELGVKLARRMNSADYLVVTHTDSAGGHLHNHIYVVNHDNLTGKALSRCRSWSRGLRQVNDELMRDEGCQVLPSPEQPKADWDLRRGAFKDGGFEQILGDKITEALLDARSVDREAFEQVLAEHEVRLRVTERDGWTYSMRRADNGKWGRRKASSLCDDFMKTKVEEVFDFHRQNTSTKEKDSERIEQAQRTASLDAALSELRAVEADRRDAPRLDRYVDLSKRSDQEGRGLAGESHARVELQEFNLEGIGERLARERAERDQEDAEQAQRDAERARRDRQRRKSREAAERRKRERLRAASPVDDENDQQRSDENDFELE